MSIVNRLSTLIRILLALAFAPLAFAQSCTLTAPSTLAGFSGQQYSLSYTGLSATPYEVQYVTDGYGNFNPGLGAGSERGISLGPVSGPTAFVLPINSLWYSNGPRLITANIYDALGSLLASCTATATTANTYPIASNPTLTFSISNGTSGTCSTTSFAGWCVVAPTLGSVGSDTVNYFYSIDGMGTSQQNNTTNNGGTAWFFSNYFLNGQHVVGTYIFDSTSGQTHSPGYEGNAGQWTRLVTFSNGSNPVAAKINSDKLYLVPGGPSSGDCISSFALNSGSCTLTAATLNADQSVTAGSVAGTTPMFFSANTAVATVGQTSGVVTAVAGSPSNTVVYSLVPFTSGTDMTTANPSGATSASNPFNLGMGALSGNPQWGCYLSGSGITTGFYVFNVVSYLGGSGLSSIFGVQFKPTLPSSVTGITYACGPIALTWVFNAGTGGSNILPYLGSDGSVNLSYNVSNAAVTHGIFAGYNLVQSDQLYTYQGDPNGNAALLNKQGNWFALEYGAGCLSGCDFTATGPTSGTYAAWKASVDSSVMAQVAALFGEPNLYFYLYFSNIINTNANLYGATAGPGASLSPPAAQYMFQDYTNTHKVLASYLHDEIPIYCPFCGPITYDPAGVGVGQTWLISLTCNGTTCTALTGAQGYTIYGSYVIVHGSAVSGMNTSYPNAYVITAINSTSFSFPSTVASGAYNYSNDPGFTMETLLGGTTAANSYVDTSGDYVPDSAFSLLRQQLNAVTGHFEWSGRPTGSQNDLAVSSLGVCNSSPYNPNNALSNYGGNSSYIIGGIPPGGYADVYSADGGNGYIVSRASLNAAVNANEWIGQTLRAQFGCGYSPNTPLQALTEGTINYFGTQPIAIPLTACSGNTCTVNLSGTGYTSIQQVCGSIIQGLTRAYVLGATDVSSPQNTANNNFEIFSCPTSTTLTVDLAATDTVATGTGGTITTSDSTTATIASMTATTDLNIYGSGETAPNGVGLGSFMNVDEMVATNVTGACGGASSATCLLRKRGQTFSFNGTATGTGAAFFNGRTFRIPLDWLDASIVGNAPNANVFYREVPSLNSTGGTFYIFHDNSYIKGQSISSAPGAKSVPNPALSGSGDINPEWMKVDQTECKFLRCSGENIYQLGNYHSGYSGGYGFTFGNAVAVLWGPARFNVTSGTTTFQTTSCLHFEDASCVAGGKALLFGALEWNWHNKYWLQPRLNAPSIGKPGEVDCAAASGSYGKIVGCINATDAPRTITIPTTPYLTSGQEFYYASTDAYGIGSITTVSAGTSSITVTLDHGQELDAVFPVTFAGELNQPSISVRLADVTSATGVMIRWAYDPYYLDVNNTIYDCGSTFPCTPPWDMNIGNSGSHQYRIIYYGTNHTVLATSDVQYQ